MKLGRALLGCLLVSAAGLTSGCSDSGVPSSSSMQPIYGGRAVPTARWPSVVQVEGRCTGVLVHERLVVFPAHCGPYPVFVRVVATGEKIETERCAPYPRAMFGGTDIAYCLLEPAAENLAPAIAVFGCELTHLQPGTPLKLVGFGYSEAGEEFGTLREADAALDALGDELQVSAPGVGTCSGDSGGPALLEVPDGESASWRVAGILSSGPVGDCQASVSYYTPLWPFIAWLEQQTGVDVSPCGSSAGAWSPTANCRRTGLPDDVQSQSGAQAYSQTCGEAYRPEPPAAASCSVNQGPRRGLPFSLVGFVSSVIVIRVRRRGARRRANRTRRGCRDR